MKKLQNLGRILSKDEQKRIKGGVVDAKCKTACSYTVGNTTTVWTCDQITYQGVPIGCMCPDTRGGGCS